MRLCGCGVAARRCGAVMVADALCRAGESLLVDYFGGDRQVISLPMLLFWYRVLCYDGHKLNK